MKNFKYIFNGLEKPSCGHFQIPQCSVLATPSGAIPGGHCEAHEEQMEAVLGVCSWMGLEYMSMIPVSLSKSRHYTRYMV